MPLELRVETAQACEACLRTVNGRGEHSIAVPSAALESDQLMGMNPGPTAFSCETGHIGSLFHWAQFPPLCKGDNSICIIKLSPIQCQ